MTVLKGLFDPENPWDLDPTFSPKQRKHAHSISSTGCIMHAREFQWASDIQGNEYPDVFGQLTKFEIVRMTSLDDEYEDLPEGAGVHLRVNDNQVYEGYIMINSVHYRESWQHKFDFIEIYEPNRFFLITITKR